MGLRRGNTYTCNLCLGLSPLGWVYFCMEDCNDPNHWLCNQDSAPAEAEGYKSELESLEFSRSVRDLAADGFYTPEQMEMLKSQKRHLHEVIASRCCNGDDDGSEDHSNPVDSPAVRSLQTSQSSSLFTFPSFGLEAEPKVPEKCTFQCCHNCRPSSLARVVISFDAVWNEEFAPIGPRDESELRVADVRIVRHLGLRHTQHAFPVHRRADSVDGSTASAVSPVNHDKGERQDSTRKGHNPIHGTYESHFQSQAMVKATDLSIKCVPARNDDVWETAVQSADHASTDSLAMHSKNQKPSATQQIEKMNSVLWSVLSEQDKSQTHQLRRSSTTVGILRSYDQNTRDVDVNLRSSSNNTIEPTSCRGLIGRMNNLHHRRNGETSEGCGEREERMDWTKQEAERYASDIIMAL